MCSSSCIFLQYLPFAYSIRHLHSTTCSDFLGFPEDSRELPIDYMTEEHREIIATKCSHPDNKKKFPNLPTSRPVGGSLLANRGGRKGSMPPNDDSSSAKSNPKKAATSVGGKKQAAAKSASKISEKAMFYHRKWQVVAEKQGGPNAKIVVSKPEAKKIIFEKS